MHRWRGICQPSHRIVLAENMGGQKGARGARLTALDALARGGLQHVLDAPSRVVSRFHGVALQLSVLSVLFAALAASLED